MSSNRFVRHLYLRARTCIGLAKARPFHNSCKHNIVKPFLLADIGEGITECQVIQWFVQPGAKVEQFDKICEVQSDKASVEITSPFDGVIKKLHYEPDAMALTGKPLVDIDIQGEIDPADEAQLGETKDEVKNDRYTESDKPTEDAEIAAESGSVEEGTVERQNADKGDRSNNLGLLATPAVRHLMKELDVRIEDVKGTGKDGRVLKEDVHRHVQSGKQSQAQPARRSDNTARTEPLSPVQNQMFKVMTKSLNIPHFLFTCSADMSVLSDLRRRLNKSRDDKITSFAFILKAVSLAFRDFELLNATLDTTNPNKPLLTYHSSHDFGIAVDTPSGLLVPVLRDVQLLSIEQIAAGLRDISDRARHNKLVPDDFQNATFTLSNIGSVGGGVVSPVISEPQVAIMGVGRSKIVPAFDEDGELCKREEVVFSWSADHRVVNGAECARCAERVKSLLEDPVLMITNMR